MDFVIGMGICTALILFLAKGIKGSSPTSSIGSGISLKTEREHGMDVAWEAIMELIARASLNETEDRDTYADGYCNGLRSALGVVHTEAQKAWEDRQLSPALDEPGKEEVDDGSR